MREQVMRNWVREHAVGIQVHRDLQREWKLLVDSPPPWLHTQATCGLKGKAAWDMTLCITGAACRQCGDFGFCVEKTAGK